MKKIKEEKGSITLFVLIAMLFFVMFLVGRYMLTANSESSQIAESTRIKEIYEKNVNNIDDVYKTLVNKDNSKINGYTSEGLVLYYDFKQQNAIQGETIKDFSMNGNDATISGATLQNNALVFDGIDDWINIKKLNYSNITIQMVMEYDAIPNDGVENSLINNFQSGGYGLSNFSLAGNTQYNKFTAYIDDNYYSVVSDNKFQANKKYYLSGSYDGNNLKLFENGDTFSYTKAGTIKNPADNVTMKIGTNSDAAMLASSSYFKGKIYSIRIYDRALTEQEIKNNYNIDVSRFENNIQNNTNN